MVKSDLAKVNMPLSKAVLPESLKSGERRKPGETLSYRLRYLPRRDGSGVATDRAFNITEVTNAYAGQELVTQVEWIPPNTRLVALFRGPPGTKSIQILKSARTASGKDAFVSSESFRQLFISPGTDEPPKTTDFEVITFYKKKTSNEIAAKQRIAVFLPPSDEHFEQTENNAVVLYDYNLKLTSSE